MKDARKRETEACCESSLPWAETMSAFSTCTAMRHKKGREWGAEWGGVAIERMVDQAETPIAFLITLGSSTAFKIITELWMQPGEPKTRREEIHPLAIHRRVKRISTSPVIHVISFPAMEMGL